MKECYNSPNEKLGLLIDELGKLMSLKYGLKIWSEIVYRSTLGLVCSCYLYQTKPDGTEHVVGEEEA